ncbi:MULTISPECIES: SDR family oxidoreductase [unclassified Nocardioides]|uniref:SDR family oxidoreductase n=1 Tax=unclassified Nocardioides TaxID=2615069 RepID=UPI000702689F|nr:MULTISPECIES: SDR family oxidoreductase [unclassified Nocardioides]KRC50121.1 oxidoreductase [Nocardioides sp. Root79]KRC75588.1 oxidoreductase [Nocardioides sp. Root240]
MDLGVRDHVYVLTGATRGLGHATATVLVADGARVVVSGRTAASVEAAVASLEAVGGAGCAVGVVADNASASAPGELVAEALDRWGRLDGVLISVGGPPGGTVSAMTDEQWLAAFDSVFLGAVRLARTVAAELSDGGSIAFVLSTSVRQPIPGLAISNGLRPGLAMVAKTLADELGPEGIRVNGLLPGRIATERVAELDASTGDAAASKAAATAQIPLGRYGRPEEFGQVAAFVLSPAASFLSGVMVPVDGGMSRGL